MNERNGTRAKWLGAGGLVIGLAIAVYSLTGLRRDSSEPPGAAARNLATIQLPGDPEPRLSKECGEQLAIQQRLASLALQAMRVFGRIDPGVFNIDNGAITLATGTATDLEKAAPAGVSELKRALSAANESRVVGQVFARARQRALELCGASGCPPEKFDIRVQERKLTDSADSVVYDFEVLGKAPTPKAWRDGFLTQYASAAAGSCPFVAPIQLSEAPLGTEATLEAPAPAPVGSAEAPAPGGAVQTLTNALWPERSIRRGTTYTDHRCPTVNYAACKQDCKLPSGNNGKYVPSGTPGQMCCVPEC
jgi:hypothetical protein